MDFVAKLAERHRKNNYARLQCVLLCISLSRDADVTLSIHRRICDVMHTSPHDRSTDLRCTDTQNGCRVYKVLPKMRSQWYNLYIYIYICPEETTLILKVILIKNR